MPSAPSAHAAITQLLADTGLQRGTGQLGDDCDWTLARLLGSLAELTGSGAGATTTVAAQLLLEAQLQGEAAAWITPTEHSFYPPDLAQNGIDLQALVVVRVDSVSAMLTAAEQLLRAGAFALIVIDLGRCRRLRTAQLTRLAGLARHHQTAVLCLTEKTAGSPSLGAPIAVYGEARRRHLNNTDFICEIEIIKDKRRPPHWRHCEQCRGPDGLY